MECDWKLKAGQEKSAFQICGELALTGAALSKTTSAEAELALDAAVFLTHLDESNGSLQILINAAS